MNLIPKKALVIYTPDFDYDDDLLLSQIVPDDGDMEVLFIHDLNHKGETVNEYQPTLEDVNDFFKNQQQSVTKESKLKIIHTPFEENLLKWMIFDNKLSVCWKKESAVIELNYENTKLKVLFPKMVMLYHKDTLYWYAYKAKKLTFDTILYTMSFPHVYQDAHVCLGSTSTIINTRIKNLTDLKEICTVIESTVLNSKWTHRFSDVQLKANKKSLEDKKYRLGIKKFDSLKNVLGILN